MFTWPGISIRMKICSLIKGKDMLKLIRDIFSIKDQKAKLEDFPMTMLGDRIQFRTIGDEKIFNLLKTIDEYQVKKYWKEAKLLAESLVEILDEKSKEKPQPPSFPKDRIVKGDII